MTNLINEYLDGVGVSELSKKYNIHRSTVQRYLKKNNVCLRKSTHRLKYDINFFNKYTPESCYWAGFICADGCIRSNRKTLSIKLASVDHNHLEKFKNNIQYKGDVKSYNTYSNISLSGSWIVDSLQYMFDITPLKTFTVRIPSNIPNNLLSHFIRGYFDGDGCITYTTCPTISFVSGSKDILLSFSKIFYDIGVRLKSKNILPPIINNSQITYSGKNAKIILDWLYSDSNPNIRLDRKYEKYLDIW